MCAVGLHVQLCSNLKVCVHIGAYNVQVQCRVVEICVRLALVWGDGPGDPWVMGHMGHGSRAQWVTWVMGHSFPALVCGIAELLVSISVYQGLTYCFAVSKQYKRSSI